MLIHWICLFAKGEGGGYFFLRSQSSYAVIVASCVELLIFVFFLVCGWKEDDFDDG